MCDTPPMTGWPPPCWPALYGVTLPQVAALAMVEIGAPANPVRTALRVVLSLGVLAGMAVWVNANRASLDLQDWCDCAGRQTTVHMIESRQPLSSTSRHAPTLAATFEEEPEPAHR